MKLNPILSALLLGSALLASHGAALAQPKPIELRYTSGAPPKGNPWVTQIERFAKEVDEESKGEIKISPFFGLATRQRAGHGAAGGARAHRHGRLFGRRRRRWSCPRSALLLMPFYFRNTAELDCVLDNHMTKPVTEAFAKKGVQFLGWSRSRQRSTCSARSR